MSRRPVALVTGGARRVGRAICMELGRSGVDVWFTFHTSGDEARTLVDELRALGSDACAHRLDLDDLSAVEAFAASVRCVDILVHNASVYGPTPLDEVTAEVGARVYRINALAPLVLTRHLAPRLSRSSLPGGGAVVAMCDIHAMGQPRRGYSVYSMSKAALAEMVRSLAVELAPDTRVNGVAPGVVAWSEHGPDSNDDMQARYLSRVPLARPGTPQEAAEAVRWLALDARYTTGQILRVDGGRSLR